MPRNLKLTLAYDGHDFSGWQVQPGRPTIQGALMSALERLTGEKTLPQGSGRTDAGVHALAQVASFTTASTIPLVNFRLALNHLLPSAIRVLAVEEAPPEFHARKSAVAKTYQYRIYRPEVCPPFLARYVHHHPWPLDEDAMRGAAGVVAGEHDFTSFAAVDPERNDPERNDPERRDADPSGKGPDQARCNLRRIYASVWERQGEELTYTVRGSGFLHHMVRNLVGTFLMVGKGRLTAGDMRRILEQRNRAAAAATAPAAGLFLIGVEY